MAVGVLTCCLLAPFLLVNLWLLLKSKKEEWTWRRGYESTQERTLRLQRRKKFMGRPLRRKLKLPADMPVASTHNFHEEEAIKRARKLL